MQHVPGAALRTLQVLTPLILTIPTQAGAITSPMLDRRKQAQRGEVTFSRSHSQGGSKSGYLVLKCGFISSVLTAVRIGALVDNEGWWEMGF